MSQENVEVVRQVFEAFNRRDWAAWESHHHPEVEWCNPPEPGSIVGWALSASSSTRRSRSGTNGTSRLTPLRVSGKTAFSCGGVLYWSGE